MKYAGNVLWRRGLIPLPPRQSGDQQSGLTVRFMKLRNFFSISVMMEKSPFGRFSLTVVTFIWGTDTRAQRGGTQPATRSEIATATGCGRFRREMRSGLCSRRGAFGDAADAAFYI